MAITRTQIARQLYKNGRRVGLKGGADAATESFGASAGYSGPGGSTGRPDKDFNPGTGGGGPTFGNAKATTATGDDFRKSKKEYEKQFGGVSPTGSRPRSIFDRINTFNKNFQRKKMLDLAKKRSLQKYQDIEQYADIMDDYGLSAEEIAEQVAANPSYGYDFSDLDKGLETLTSNRDTSIESTRPNLYDVNSTLKGRFAIGNILTDAIRKDTQVTGLNTLNKARDYTGLVNTSSNMTNKEIKDAMTDLQNRGKTKDQIDPPRDGDGPSDPCKGPNPPAYCFVGIR